MLVTLHHVALAFNPSFSYFIYHSWKQSSEIMYKWRKYVKFMYTFSMSLVMISESDEELSILKLHGVLMDLSTIERQMSTLLLLWVTRYTLWTLINLALHEKCNYCSYVVFRMNIKSYFGTKNGSWKVESGFSPFIMSFIISRIPTETSLCVTFKLPF